MSTMSDEKYYPKEFPPEQQDQPGIERRMKLKPEFIKSTYKGSQKLQDRVALITGGDSGIGRSVAIHFAREGADIAISYLAEREKEDALETQKLVEKEGRKCLLLPGDLREKEYCSQIVEDTVKQLGKLNILVLNAAVQHPHENILDLKDEEILETFNINIISLFRTVKASMKYLHEGDSIIMNASINAFRGHKELVDYSSTKGAIMGFSRSLSGQLAEKKIRVNAVAPGPIWTPLIVSSFDEDKIKTFGQDTPLGRAGQPSECGPAFVFLASDDSSYFTGQCLHPNGGHVLNS
jgi:NAD(P)-dependent dehydrogenase (short-subunit alcohol dehydrogenase family)